jgi:hypothetical protein
MALPPIASARATALSYERFETNSCLELMKKRFHGPLRIRADNVELRSVTGRQKYAFVDATDPREPRQRIGQCRVWDSKTLPDLDVSPSDD